jgi:hypothetical protein
VIIIADGHELPTSAGHRNEQTSGTPQDLSTNSATLSCSIASLAVRALEVADCQSLG